MPTDKGKKPVVHTKKHVARLQRERQQTRNIMIAFISILVVAIGAVVYGALDVNYFQVMKPVAKVGTVEITVKEFQTRVRLQRNSLISTYMQYSQFAQMFGMDLTSQLQQIQTQLSDPTSLGQNVLDSMINEELVRQEAAKRGITVSDTELDAAIKSAYSFYPNGSPTPTLTPTELVFPTLSSDILKYVTATPDVTATPTIDPNATATATATIDPNATATATATATVTLDPNITITATSTANPAFTATLEPSPSPTPSATLAPSATPTASLTPTATIDPKLPTVTPLPSATPFTLEGFNTVYNKGLAQFAKFGLTEAQYRVLYRTDLMRKILYGQVTADVPAVDEQIWARHILVADEATALKVIQRLKNGEDFGKLAAELSTDTGSGAKGGDLGWFGKGAMVAPFEAAAFALKIGEISAPVKSDFGYHIIQVIARQTRPLTATELQTARDAVFGKFLSDLRTTDKVVTYDIWKTNVPTDPSMESIATEAAQTQNAAPQ